MSGQIDRCIYGNDSRPSAPKMTMTLPPEVLFAVQESKALAHALDVLDGGSTDRDAARNCVEGVLSKLHVLEAEDQLIQLAMAKIAGTILPEGALAIETTSPDRKLFTTVAHAWSLWARGDSEGAKKVLREGGDDITAKGAALHLMSLHFWSGAVKALTQGETAEARRLFLRAIDIGTQVGTETVPAIQWTYAASFFHVLKP